MKRRPPSPPLGFMARLRRDRRGVAAIEFAFIAPVMIVMYFGVAEICTVLMAQRRTAHADSAIGDLAAQTDKIYDSDMSDIFSVASTVLSPYDTSGLQLRLTSVTTDAANVPKVDWSAVKSSGQPDLPALACKATVSTLPANVVTSAGDNVLMAEAVYNYSSPIGYAIQKSFKFQPKYYTKPRLSAKVARYVGGANSTTPACP